ncbi:sigma-70 family RNA polymerase sigma factor [Streptomyces sp. cmx-4-9]|uniref:sigma-70 family RNA polymerase sigma factor n=1 Tax=Streptomyces sp. cmx-4-9 TaxID=2790941 RepID=UPI00397F71A7
MAIVAVQERISAPAPIRPERKRGSKREERARGALLTGNGPGGRRLHKGEIVPLSVEESTQLGELYERHGAWMRAAARNRLTRQGLTFAEAETLADDLVMDAWVRLARKRGELLAGALDEETERRFLATAVKAAVADYYALRRAHELPQDFGTPEYEDVAAPPMILPGQEDLSPRCRELLADLSPELREVMVEFCYGAPQRAIAELLGVNVAVVNRLVKRAVAALRAQDPDAQPEPETAPVALESLPEQQRRALEALDEHTRMVLLLRLAGVTYQAIADRTERSMSTVFRMAKQYGHLLLADAA